DKTVALLVRFGQDIGNGTAKTGLFGNIELHKLLHALVAEQYLNSTVYITSIEETNAGSL
ncbi:MAG: hypothetical protein ACJAR0_002005, partial [Candidatus Azotimanducaceae bacterium]